LRIKGYPLFYTNCYSANSLAVQAQYKLEDHKQDYRISADI